MEKSSLAVRDDKPEKPKPTRGGFHVPAAWKKSEAYEMAMTKIASDRLMCQNAMMPLRKDVIIYSKA